MKENINVSFSKIYVDFIETEYDLTEKRYRLTVIDAKNSGRVKKGAEVQIAFYMLALEYILKKNKIDNCYVNEETAIVWNKETGTNRLLPHEFELKEAVEEIKSVFLEKDLKNICKTISNCNNTEELLDSLKMMIQYKCEYCNMYETCLEHCKERKSVRLLPYIRPEDQKKLDELIKGDSISEVGEYLVRKDERLTEGSYFWKQIKNNWDAYRDALAAYFEGSKIESKLKTNSSSVTMPQKQDYALVLTAQQDPDSGRVYAYAWRLVRFANGSTYEDKTVKNSKGYAIAKNNSEEEFNKIDKNFVNAVHDCLSVVSDKNKKEKDYRKKVSLQCYVMDVYERKNINDTLFSMLRRLDTEKDKDLLKKGY
ncbi:MAG: hypothetical protein IJ555_04315 [Ruminococcus sp.]|nr:hypothetical protein [Ruminococcus sp.]